MYACYRIFPMPCQNFHREINFFLNIYQYIIYSSKNFHNWIINIGRLISIGFYLGFPTCLFCKFSQTGSCISIFDINISKVLLFFLMTFRTINRDIEIGIFCNITLYVMSWMLVHWSSTISVPFFRTCAQSLTQWLLFERHHS